MKNLLKNTLYLFVFALAGILFQISCSNSDNQKAQSITQIGKLIYAKQISSDNHFEIWTCNYDGSNQAQIPIVLPTNVQFNFSGLGRVKPRLSPDGQTVFFVALNTTAGTYLIFSCDLNGNNLQQVSAISGANDLDLGGAY